MTTKKAWHSATWVDPDAPEKKRRFSLGWLWLLLIPAALIIFSIFRFNNYWQHADWTVTTYACDQALAADATWSDMEAAGCSPTAIPGAEVVLLDAGYPAEHFETDGTTWTFENMPAAFSTSGLNVFLEDSAGEVFVVDGSSTPPTVLHEMGNSDVARTVFTRNLGDIDTTDLIVVVAPQR